MAVREEEREREEERKGERGGKVERQNDCWIQNLERVRGGGIKRVEMKE